MPRVHGIEIGAQRARLAALEGHDVELRVRPHDLAILRLDEDNPFAVGRDLGEAVAHAVLAGADDALGFTAFAVVERDAVEVVLNLRFVGIVGVVGQRLAVGVGIASLGAREDDIFAVRAPDAAGLHVTRIGRAGQRVALAFGAVVVLEDAARGIEDLEEFVVGEVADVEGLLKFKRGAGEGADDVAAAGRDLRHEADADFAHGAVDVPLHYFAVIDGDVAADGRDGVEAFVVLRAVEVDAHGFAVAREGMAVEAGGYIVQNGVAVGPADVAQTPLDEVNGVGGERLHYAFGVGGRHERHVAIEDGCANLVSGCGESDLAGGRNDAAVAIAGDGERCRMRFGVELNLRPGCDVGRPNPRGSLPRVELRRLVGGGDAARIDGADLHVLPLRFGVDGGRVVREGNGDLPGSGGGIAPDDRRLRDAGRKDGALLGIVDGDGVVGSGLNLRGGCGCDGSDARSYRRKQRCSRDAGEGDDGEREDAALLFRDRIKFHGCHGLPRFSYRAHELPVSDRIRLRCLGASRRANRSAAEEAARLSSPLLSTDNFTWFDDLVRRKVQSPDGPTGWSGSSLGQGSLSSEQRPRSLSYRSTSTSAIWMGRAMPRNAGTASDPMICGETKRCTRSTRPAARSAVLRRVPVSVTRVRMPSWPSLSSTWASGTRPGCNAADGLSPAAAAVSAGITSTRTPRRSSSLTLAASLETVKTTTSFEALRTIFESSGMRSAESSTTRRSGRRRRRPLRSVSSGSSASTVSTPVSAASACQRSGCTAAREASHVIQKGSRSFCIPEGGAMRPSRVMATFIMTSGRLCRLQRAKPSLSRRASPWQTPTAVSIPAAFSASRPWPATLGLGSMVAATTRPRPAAMIALVQGGVRPVWLQGSRVTYMVPPLMRSPACCLASLSATTSAWSTRSYSCQPSPTTWPARSRMTQPTAGLGELTPMPRRASSSARCIQ